MQPNDPLYAQQWHFGKLGNIEKIWDEFSGVGIHVGVYDGGIELTHPDLAGSYDPSRRVVIDGVPLDGLPNETMPAAHGTAVVGLISASANNGQGGVGVAWGSTFTSVDFLDPSSAMAASFPNYYSGFHQLVNFDIANHSWNVAPGLGYTQLSNLYGGDEDDEYPRINEEYDHASVNGRGGLGTVLVQGAGNDNADAQLSGLNASRFTITVGGLQHDGFAWSGSNYGASLLVTAPSRHIVTADLAGSAGSGPDDYIDAAEAADNVASPPDGVSGTSLSGPVVSGLVALMLDANPNLGWRDVQNIIAASATHTGSTIGATTLGTNENSNWFINDAVNWNGGGMHFSNDYGYGMANAYNAVRMAEVWSLFVPAQVSANEQVWHTEDHTDQVIPDNGTLQFSVSLPSSPITLEHVELRVDLTHADYTQLRIFLVSPSGTEMQLYDGSGGSDTTADGVFNWTYGGEALRGEDASGNWTVRIEDAAAGETGTLLWYNLVVYGSADSTDDIYHYTDEFLAMAGLAGEGGRATLADANGGADWIDAAAVTGNVVLNLSTGATVDGVNWFTIAAGTVIENAVTGDGNDTITGNSAANQLYGMRGDDTLDGGIGADSLYGGRGSDTYLVDDSGDVADESGGGGIDGVFASVNFVLGADLENLTLQGAAIAGTGNALANILTGNANADTLDGAGGADLLNGLGGSDLLVGGEGADQFLFDTALSKKKSVNRDHIADFVHLGDDIVLDKSIFTKLKLGDLKKGAFAKAKEAEDDGDRIIYNMKNGELAYDKDGEGGKKAIVFAILDGGPNDVGHKDFLVIA